jgi:membrane protein
LSASVSAGEGRAEAGARRSPIKDFLWTARDYIKRVWDNSGEDNVLFLAGGIAFNILLAALPFMLLLAAGITYILPIVYAGSINSTDQIGVFIDRLLPAHVETDSPVHRLINDLLRTRRSVTIYSAIGFIWFSTRLFGSLRTVLASVFDIETERGIIAGKVFDVKITVVSTLLFAASVTLTTYVGLASHALVSVGLRTDVLSGVDYWVGRVLGFAFLALMFYALYKFLPIRRVTTASAWVAAGFTSVCFEGARILFANYTRGFNPGGMYRGTLTAIVFVVVWCYYSALIFILGGEVGQVYELRRVRRLQREVLTD